MGLMTGEQYLETIRRQKPEVWLLGKKIENVADSVYFEQSLKENMKFYDWTHEQEYRDDFVYWSDLIDEEVSFWTHLCRTPDEIKKMVSVMKKNNARNFCSFCMASGWSVYYMMAWDIDQAKGTRYLENFLNVLKTLQKEDLRCSITVMDPKGDRSLPPGKQEDPDLFLRVVERRADGIVVNGAKMHTSAAPVTHYLFVAPSRVMTADDADYALSFVCPVDTKGITFVTRPGPCPPNPDPMANPASSKHTMVECLTVFDNVFIPWENVFMCGEWEFTENYITYFSAFVRSVKAACTTARTNMIAGAAALIADYNGISKASHIRYKLNEMALSSEIGWGCITGAISEHNVHPSGLTYPNVSISNAGLYHIRLKFVEFLGMLMEMAGGVVTTMPTVADYRNEKTRPLIDKYFKTKKNVATEDRLKLLYFIQELTASRFGGYFLSSAICAGGTPETNRVEVLRNYDLLTQINNVKAICNISD